MLTRGMLLANAGWDCWSVAAGCRVHVAMFADARMQRGWRKRMLTAAVAVNGCVRLCAALEMTAEALSLAAASYAAEAFFFIVATAGGSVFWLSGGWTVGASLACWAVCVWA